MKVHCIIVTEADDMTTFVRLFATKELAEAWELSFVKGKGLILHETCSMMEPEIYWVSPKDKGITVYVTKYTEQEVSK